jgi:hypothetical protein
MDRDVGDVRRAHVFGIRKLAVSGSASVVPRPLVIMVDLLPLFALGLIILVLIVGSILEFLQF